jgi:beta-alanine--pyruvate transaminase
VACAAALATLDLLEKESVFQRVRELSPHFENAVHGLKGVRHVGDVRNFGLAAGITLLPLPGEPLRRPYEAAMRMYAKGFYVRYGGDVLAFAPPFISTREEIERFVSALAETLEELP